jgi:hypothetical protein
MADTQVVIVSYFTTKIFFTVRDILLTGNVIILARTIITTTTTTFPS